MITVDYTKNELYSLTAAYEEGSGQIVLTVSYHHWLYNKLLHENKFPRHPDASIGKMIKDDGDLDIAITYDSHPLVTVKMDYRHIMRYMED